MCVIDPAYIFVQALIHCVLSINGKKYFTQWALSSGLVLQVPDSYFYTHKSSIFRHKAGNWGEPFAE